MPNDKDTGRDTKVSRETRAGHLSKDGKWRSFPKVPNLLQYVSTGRYYARIKSDGKLIRRSIEADSFTAAKDALRDFLARFDEPEPVRGTIGTAIRAYLRQTNLAHDLSDQTKRYRRYCLRALLESWPGLRMLKADKITEDNCREWANRFSAKHDEQYFNNTLSIFRSLIELAGIGRDHNPARKVKRLGIKPTELRLPERDQFNRIVELVETSGAGQQQACADFIRFLAYSGCRLSEARQVTWDDIDMSGGQITVINAKRSKRSSHAAKRKVPMIGPMRDLLTRLATEPHKPEDRVCRVGECEKSLTRACKLIGIPRITHHDLRHLFATRCIEAGVDIPTISRWLGHVDGGALAMRVYGHLCDEHSQNMAQKVTFDPVSNVLPLTTPVVAAR